MQKSHMSNWFVLVQNLLFHLLRLKLAFAR